MNEETERDIHERLMQEAVCGLVGHKYETFTVPIGWEHFSGAISCEYCTYSAMIDFDIELAPRDKEQTND